MIDARSMTERRHPVDLRGDESARIAAGQPVKRDVQLR
jgi:hypothetical protein